MGDSEVRREPSAGSLSEKKPKLVVRNKRLFPGENTSENAAKRSATMDEEMASGDELEELDIDEPLICPPSNFSAVQNNPLVQMPNEFRAVLLRPLISKKLVIKNLKVKNDEPVVFQSYWNVLKDGIHAVYESRNFTTSRQKLYEMVVTLCQKKEGPKLFDCLRQVTKSHLEQYKKKLLQSEVPGNDYLKIVEGIWNEFCEQMSYIRHVFLFLDRNVVLPNQTMMSIRETSVSIFREVIMNNSSIEKRTVKYILEQIDEERTGKLIDRDLLRSVLRMLTSLQIYEQIFQTPFLSSTTEMFKNEGDTLSHDLEAADYLHHVNKRVNDENMRFEFYLDECTRKPLNLIFDTYLIENQAELILNKGLDNLLDQNKKEELLLLYNLLRRVKEGLNMLKISFSAYIKTVGKTMVNDSERDKTMVDELMTFKSRLDVIIRECFAKSEKFMQAEKDAFDFFVNTRPNKPAELIAKYMDSKLRSANKEASDDELDQIMDKVVTLFRFIQGKDVFEAFYKKDLAKRLLLGRSASVDAEKAMLCKLKQECGPGFTYKLEGMFKDMEISKDLICAFKQHNDHEAQLNKPSVSTDFNVNVLTLGQWPPYEPVDICLPPQLFMGLQLYNDFYISRHNGRRLQWQHSLGQCTLRAVFKTDVVKELHVSLYQALVLLLFNNGKQFTLSEIAEATKINPKELKRTMLSLACAKIRVLNKSPKGKDFNDADLFSVNDDLQERLYRIKISQVQMKETEEDHQQTEEQVNQDRQHQIDAAIVRIMKTRKTLTHTSLIAELFAQLRFPVKSADLKKRIGSLIERDYINRESEDSTTYKYVA